MKREHGFGARLSRQQRRLTTCLGIACVTLFAAAAHAEPLVVMDGGEAKAGVVTAWSGKGKKIELTVAEGSDASAVAAAIESNVDRVRCKVRSGKILVIGKTEADLLSALAGVEFGGEEDLSLLAAASMDDAIDSGSSLRAKKTAKIEKLLKDRATVAQGKVVRVEQGAFPTVKVSVRILRGPTGAMGRQVRKGKTITFEPSYVMKDGRPDYDDRQTQLNLGAYFLQAGDRVQIKVRAGENGSVRADLITR